MPDTPIPVILDTDIGGDIDDTWALVMLLNSPELDLKMVVSDSGNTVYRAKLLARLLEVAGRTDVPVAVGIQEASDGPRERQAAWVADYDLDQYPGTVHHNGVEALVDALAAEPLTLICIGPVPNIGRALEQAPGIAAKTRFVGMHGSVHRQHGGKEGAIAEYNVKKDARACQRVFAAPWRAARITPLDTCGIVRLTGEKYAQVHGCQTPLARALMENYRIWSGKCDWSKLDPAKESSILFDTVAVHLAYSTEYLRMERMGLRVTDEGFTVPDENAPPMEVALDWTDLPAFEDDLVRRLTA